MPRRKKTRVLAAGPKACLNALRSLATVGASSGDTYHALRSPTLWPNEVHEDIKDAWTALASGGFEVPGHVLSATLQELRGLKLVPGFRVRLPTGSDPELGPETHPTFAKGTGRTPAFMRLRDFIDSLVLTAEATLARDAQAAPLAKGKTKLPEQRALRQHLGLPVGNSAAGRAKLRPRDFQQLMADAGTPLGKEQLAKLVALVGGPLPDVPALVRSAKQPVPYLEAERLMLSALPKRAFQEMLSKPAEPAPPVARSKPPLPDWHAAYLHAAVQAAAAERAGGAELQALVAAEALPHEAPPLSASREALESWWLGAQ